MSFRHRPTHAFAFVLWPFLLLLASCGGGSDATGMPSSSVAALDGRKTAQAVSSSASVNWVYCAAEGEVCSFSGTREVRYGTDTQTTSGVFSDGTPCTNGVFGDPVVGQVKACHYADTTQAGANPSPTSTWVKCADEGQACSFSGTRAVRYGVEGHFATLSIADGTPCTNGVFGDPAYGTAKSCYYEEGTPSAPPQPTPPPVPSEPTPPAPAPEPTPPAPVEPTPPAPTPPDTAWVACASESQFCAFSGTRQVRYGTATVFYTATHTDGVSCSNNVFGDPIVGYVKACAYAAAAVVVVTPEPPAPPVPGATGSNPPIVLNASGSARPGDLISLQGEGFGNAPKVFLDSAPGSSLEIVNRVGSGWLAVQIPAGAGGALTLRVDNGSGTSAQVKLNAARPLHLDALQLVPGGAFRVFGRNLLLAGSTPSVTIDGTPAAIDLARSDEHVLYATAPSALGTTAKASIKVDNGNGSGAASLDRTIEVVSGSGDPFGLGVGWAAGFSSLSSRVVNAASDPRLQTNAACNGSSDDAWPIQTAIDLAAAGGGGVVRLPAGTCRLGGGLALKSNVVIEGAGKDATRLLYNTNYPVFGVGIDLAGLRNLSLENAGGSTEGPLLKDSTRVFLQNLRVQLGSSRQMYLSGNRNAIVTGSDFIQSGSISFQGPYVFNESSGFVFQGNTTRWVGGAPSFGRIHDAVIQGNRFTRDGTRQDDPGSGTVHSLTIDFAHRIAVTGNTFDVAGGPIRNKTRNDGETILSEGGGASRTENLGNVASAGPTTLSDPGNPLNVDPFGTSSIPENYGVAIVAGKGAGQTRRVVAYQGGTMTVEPAWEVVPDATSRYASFVWGLEKALIKGNTLAQNPRGIWLYHTAIRDVEVVGNSISEGGGIYLRSYQNLAQKAFMPIYNVLIAKNRVANSTGNWMSYINAVFVNSDARAFGIANLGIEMKSNDVIANSPNVGSSWEEYANTEGFMSMMRIENYAGYESSGTPRQLGTLVTNNSCTNCDAAVRVGTGAGGTTILNTRMVNSKALLDDWATAGGTEKSTDTVAR